MVSAWNDGLREKEDGRCYEKDANSEKGRKNKAKVITGQTSQASQVLHAATAV